MGILISFDSYRASTKGALTIRLWKLHTIERQIRELQSQLRESESSPTTVSSCPSAASTTDYNTKSENTLSGTWATRFFGAWRFSRFPVTTKRGPRLSKRHFGLSHIQRRK